MTESECLHESEKTEGNFEWEREKLKEQSKIAVGGRLKFFWKEWRAIGASKKIARWLCHGYRLPFRQDGEQEARGFMKSTCPKDLIPSYPKDSVKGKALREMMDVLLEKEVIEKVPEGELCFFNVVFLRPKPNGKWRLILDVSKLNKFLVVKKFKMDTSQVIRDALVPNLWASSIDFSDAYHHIPIHKNYRCFLAFQIGEVTYRYCACPFGLSPLPQVFTEVCMVVKVFAREQWKCVVFQYIDDWLFVSEDRKKTNDVTRLFVRLCIRLGLVVNLEKSQLVATQQLVHLGVLWNFKDATLRPTDDKIESISKLATQVKTVRRSTLQSLESLMGKMISVEKFIPWARLHYRVYQRNLLKELRYGRVFRWVKLPECVNVDLNWWSVKENLSKWVPCCPKLADLVIHTDASRTGWGVSCDRWQFGDTWSRLDLDDHINVLEMRAVEILLQMKGEELKDKVLCLRIDNLSVVYYLRKMGGHVHRD